MLISPAYDLQHVASYIEKTLLYGQKRPSAASIHGTQARVFHAKDLGLEKFLSADVYDLASLSKPRAGVARTILLTGATGYLGRFLCLQLLEELDKSGGRLICIVRGRDIASATRRLLESFGSADAFMSRKVRTLSASLEVLPGDISEPKLGLDAVTWGNLGRDVDSIVHSGALVNHLLGYNSLFDANVAGTAEKGRLLRVQSGEPAR